jgi:hypothetical protein
MFDADLTQREVEAPCGHWCASGHAAPLLFKRSDGTEGPTRFFHIIGHGIDGVYCELCLIVAHWNAEQQRKSKR